MDSKLFENAQPSMRSNLLLADNGNVDISVTATDLVPCYSVFNVTDDKLPIQHEYNGSNAHYLDLQNSFLYTKCTIVKLDGNKLTADSAVALTTLAAHAIYDGVELYINDQLVSCSSHFYGYKAYLSKLLSSSHDAQDTSLTTEFWLKQGAADTFDNTNTAWQARVAKTALSVRVEFCTRLVESMMNQNKYLPPGTTLRLVLRRNNPAFFMECPDATLNYKLKVDESVYYLRRHSSHANILEQHKALSDSSKYYYPIKPVQIRSFNIAKGVLSYTSEAVNNDALPSLILVGLMESVAVNGSAQKSCFNFTHFNAKEVVARVEDDASLYQSVKVGGSGSLCMMAYRQLLDTIATQHRQTYLTLDQFKNGNFLFAFSYNGNNATGAMSPRQTGKIKLDFTFSAATPEVLQAIVYTIHQGLVTIDKHGAVNVIV